MKGAGFPTMDTRSPGKLPRHKRKSNLSFTSTTEATRDQKKTLYASKFTCSDPAMQRMLRRYAPSAKPIKAKGSPMDGASGQSIGGIRRKLKGKPNPYPRSSAVPPSQRAKRGSLEGQLQLTQIGVLEEKQNENTIFLDYDRTRTPKLSPLFFLLRLCEMRPLYVVDVRTRKGWHRVVHLDCRLKPAEIVAAQALLGSDRRRESLNFMRILSLRRFGATNFARSRWNLMFTRKLKRRKMHA